MEHLVCHFFSSGIGAVLCQLPVLYSAARASERASARTPQHIKTSLWLLVSLALIYASRKLCCVKSARGERATRAVVGWVLSDLAAVLIKTWAQVRDRLTLTHTHVYIPEREMSLYCSRLHAVKGLHRSTDRLAAWLGCKNAHAARRLTFVLLTSAHTRDWAPPARCPNAFASALEHECWLFSLSILKAGLNFYSNGMEKFLFLTNNFLNWRNF